MKLLHVLAISVFLVGCGKRSEEPKPSPAPAYKAQDVYVRWSCTTYRDGEHGVFNTPWTEDEDTFTGDKCLGDHTICWWGTSAIQADSNVRHKFFYVPEPGAVCHYETAKGQKPFE